MTEVLTREIGLKKNLLPTGKKVEVVALSQAGLFKIKTESGTLPKQYAGMYTSRQRAEAERDKYLKDFWNMSDAASRKKDK